MLKDVRVNREGKFGYNYSKQGNNINRIEQIEKTRENGLRPQSSTDGMVGVAGTGQ